VTAFRKRLSSEGHGRADVPTTARGRSDVTPGAVGATTDAGPSDPAAPTLAYAPKRRAIPEQIGQYQLLGPIGRGGMGVVYKGYHPRLQRYVAIKLLHGLHLADNTAVIRLQREQAAAGRVEHENIIYAFDAGEQDGVDFLVMEFVEGVDLARLVAASGTLTVADACEIARQAALGLAHIEACGLVHRDIKPSNLMLSRAGVVKILDLGLARLREGPIDEEEATHSGFLLGTADYMSPEQIDTPREADVRSDLYSLGCALFKLLAGHAPFGDKEHSSYSQKIDAHRREPPPPVRTLRADVPEALDHLLSRLLAKDPADRPQHPGDVAAALAPFAAGADLRALVRRAPAAAETAIAPAQVADTPSGVSESTQPQCHTPTPQKSPATDSSRWSPRLVGALAMAGAALALMLLGPWIWASLTGGGAPDHSGGQTSRGNQAPAIVTTTPIADPLLAAAQAVPLPQGDRPQTLEIVPKFQMIEASADDFQLIQLGTLEPGTGTISLDLEFRRDRGEAGLFFGYHEENIVPDRLWGIGHFVHLSLLPSKTDERLFSFIREQSHLRPGNTVLVSMAERRLKLAPTSANTFRLAVDYVPEGIKEIRLDERAIPDMLTTGFGNAFDPQTTWGVWGLYNNGSSIRVYRPTLTKGP
jgi:serine/threonine protein kinase